MSAPMVRLKSYMLAEVVLVVVTNLGSQSAGAEESYALGMLGTA